MNDLFPIDPYVHTNMYPARRINLPPFNLALSHPIRKRILAAFLGQKITFPANTVNTKDNSFHYFHSFSGITSKTN